MTKVHGGISLWRPIFFTLISLVQFFSGLADNPASPKNDKKVKPKSSNVGLEVVLIILGIVAVVLFSVFLFKIWQKKKREEQHARLLRLFEEDDELEVELGLRD